MGEHGVLSGSSHFWSSVMRNSRGKFFVYVGLLGAMCFVIFLLSSTHSSLKQLEGVNEKCQQQRDSLSAQLQVLYEHKNRLEKSLQQEKADHRHTKEETEKQLHEEENKVQQEKEKEQSLENQITQLKSSYSELEEERKQAEASLKEQLQSTQNVKDAEIQKLRAQINDLLAEKEKLQQSNSAFEWKIHQHESEVNLCRLQYQQLESKLSDCNELLSKKNSPAASENIHPNEIPELGQETKNEDKQTNPRETQNASEALGHMKQLVLERPHQKNNKDDSLVDPLKNFNEQSEDVKNKPPNTGNVDLDNKNESLNEHKNKFPIPLFSKNKEPSFHLGVDKKKDEPSNEVVLAGIPSPQDADKGNEIDQGNLPQVVPPNNMDPAAEKGEYVNGIHQQQLEQPEFKESNDVHQVNGLKKSVLSPPISNNDQAAAQVKDMLGKSPADANNDRRNNPLHIPPHDFGASDNKNNQFNKDTKFLNGRAQHLVADDKQYVDEDDDDQDGENEDDPGMGGGQGPRGKVFQEQDFEDQEPNDNNAREEEGVMVAPK